MTARPTLLDAMIDAEDEPSAYDVIDCHCHAGPGDGFNGPWDSHAPLDRYLERADAAGIRRTVIFAAFHSDYAVANAGVARIVASDPARFVGFAFVHAERDRGRIAQLVGEMVTRHGFRGIKCHRSDARISREICDAGRRFRVPILYDVLAEAQSVDLFAPQYPDVNFIIPHLGSFADDWRAQQAMVDILRRHPNVYTDTSGVRRFDYIVDAIRNAGAAKVLFGSDGPWLHPGLELAKVDLLNLSATDRRLVVSGNVTRLLRLEHAPSARRADVLAV